MDLNMEAEFEALSLFSEELPDHETLLSNQTPYSNDIISRHKRDKLKSFTSFNRLPYELRVMIWLLSFTPRRIRVNTRATNNLPEGRRIFFKSLTRPPALFCVNHESRELAMKHYDVLLQEGEHGIWKTYFCPDLDIVVFPDVEPLQQGRLFKHISPHLKAAFAKVQKLELRNMWWTAERTLLTTGRAVRRSVEEARSDIVAGYFVGLKELVIHAEKRKGQRCGGLLSPEMQRACQAVMRAYLKMKHRKVAGYHPPKVALYVSKKCTAGL